MPLIAKNIKVHKDGHLKKINEFAELIYKIYVDRPK